MRYGALAKKILFKLSVRVEVSSVESNETTAATVSCDLAPPPQRRRRRHPPPLPPRNLPFVTLPYLPTTRPGQPTGDCNAPNHTARFTTSRFRPVGGETISAPASFGHIRCPYGHADQWVRRPARGFLLVFYSNHSAKMHRFVGRDALRFVGV